MPRNVRNFWIETTVDGQKTPAKGTGPIRKDGGFRTVVLMRNNGSIVRALELDGYVDSSGAIVLRASSGREVIAKLDNVLISADADLVITTKR